MKTILFHHKNVFFFSTAILFLLISPDTSKGQSMALKHAEKTKGDSVSPSFFGEFPETDETVFPGLSGQENMISVLRSGFLKNSKENFLTMEGSRFSHPVNDEDIFSGKLIYELRDSIGKPLWFCRYVHKDVCATGSCKMVRLWMFWDGAGEYLGIRLLNEEPLTKLDHDEFEPEDYLKLDEILRDTASVLREYSDESLYLELEGFGDKQKGYMNVDAVSGATPPSLATAVVKDAVYTCHALWHTVYGSTRGYIMKQLNQRLDTTLLRLYFDFAKPSYVSWAIKKIADNPEFHHLYYPRIITFIGHKNAYLSRQAINYFKPEFLKEGDAQKSILAILPDLNPNDQNLLLWKLSELDNVAADTPITLLRLFLDNKIGQGTLVLIYRMIKPDHLKDRALLILLEKISQAKNAYWRTLTEKLLKENGKDVTWK